MPDSTPALTQPDSWALDPAVPIGFIGLGLLGSALAQRALAAGLSVVGYDRDASRQTEFERAGGRGSAHASAVAQQCPWLIFALPQDHISRQVLDEIAAVLRPGTVILDATTGTVESAVALAARVEQLGSQYLDATISGSSVDVARGTAVFMVGGPEAAFARCRSLLEKLAGQALHAGRVGDGARLKLVTNLVLGLNRAALAEGLVLAKALGVAPERALAVMKAGAAFSRVMETKGPAMVSGNFAPQARLSQHLKDVRLILAAAEATGQPLPLSRTHRELLEAAEGFGLGALDNSAVISALERLRTPPSTAA